MRRRRKLCESCLLFCCYCQNCIRRLSSGDLRSAQRHRSVDTCIDTDQAAYVPQCNKYFTVGCRSRVMLGSARCLSPSAMARVALFVVCFAAQVVLSQFASSVVHWVWTKPRQQAVCGVYSLYQLTKELNKQRANVLCDDARGPHNTRHMQTIGDHRQRNAAGAPTNGDFFVTSGNNTILFDRECTSGDARLSNCLKQRVEHVNLTSSRQEMESMSLKKGKSRPSTACV